MESITVGFAFPQKPLDPNCIMQRVSDAAGCVSLPWSKKPEGLLRCPLEPSGSRV